MCIIMIFCSNARYPDNPNLSIRRLDGYFVSMTHTFNINKIKLMFGGVVWCNCFTAYNLDFNCHILQRERNQPDPPYTAKDRFL